jgi:Leucine-rich repeat (LRR) protein
MSSPESESAFSGAVGFFDAPSETRGRANSLGDGGAMGFFEFLDERTLGLVQAAFHFDGTKESKKLNWSELEAMLQDNPMMAKLVLRACHLRPVNLQVLSGSLMALHNLQTLDLSQNALGVAGVTALTDSCRGNVSLSELRLSQILAEVAPAEFDAVCQIFEDFPSLKLLDLSKNNLSAELLRSIAVAAGKHDHLQELHLEDNNITIALATTILHALRDSTSLQLLHLDSLSDGKPEKKEALTPTKRRGPDPTAKPPRTRSSVRVLISTLRSSLSTNTASSSNPTSLGGSKTTLIEALAHNLSLRVISMDESWTSRELDSMLFQNGALWKLRDSTSPGRADVAGRSLSFVPGVILSLTHMTELDLSLNALRVVPESFTVLSSLTWLSLERNEIGPLAIPVHLVALRKLKHLNVTGNPFAADLSRDVAPGDVSAIMGWMLSQGAILMAPQVVVTLFLLFFCFFLPPFFLSFFLSLFYFIFISLFLCFFLWVLLVVVGGWRWLVVRVGRQVMALTGRILMCCCCTLVVYMNIGVFVA